MHFTFVKGILYGVLALCITKHRDEAESALYTGKNGKQQPLTWSLEKNNLHCFCERVKLYFLPLSSGEYLNV